MGFSQSLELPQFATQRNTLIVRIGMDVVEVDRIERAMRRQGFLERILTPKERQIYRTPARVAARWSAKEAIAKAIGNHLTWQQVEILPDAEGCPVVAIQSPHWDPGRYALHLSITHERNIAAAVAILEERERGTSPPR